MTRHPAQTGRDSNASGRPPSWVAHAVSTASVSDSNTGLLSRVGPTASVMIHRLGPLTPLGGGRLGAVLEDEQRAAGGRDRRQHAVL